MAGARIRPLGVTPVVIAVAIWSAVQVPSPVFASGVRLGGVNEPMPGMLKVESEPANRWLMSGCGENPPGVWQSPQPTTLTRYWPRATSDPPPGAQAQSTAATAV